jgi:5-formyltetrahydrofolate cyclo-ligase
MDAVLTCNRHLLRQEALERRNSLSSTDACLWSRRIQAKVLALDCYQAANAIAIYNPVPNEVDTGSLLDHALASGKKVFLPRWLTHEFGFAQITSRSELTMGRFGISEPIKALALTDSDKQNLLVFVPGVALTHEATDWGAAAVPMIGCLRHYVGGRGSLVWLTNSRSSKPCRHKAGIAPCIS